MIASPPLNLNHLLLTQSLSDGKPRDSCLRWAASAFGHKRTYAQKVSAILTQSPRHSWLHRNDGGCIYLLVGNLIGAAELRAPDRFDPADRQPDRAQQERPGQDRAERDDEEGDRAEE